MGLKYEGQMPLAGNIKVNKDAPLDNREVVDSVEDLINPDTFGNYAFVGMLVYVVSTKEHYVLTALPNNLESNWKKITSEPSSPQETVVITI